VNVFVLSDKRCPDCETDKIAEGIKSKIEKPVLKILDYGDPDGRKLYDEIKPGALPIVAFDATLREDADSWEELGGSAKPAGSYSYIPAGGRVDARVRRRRRLQQGGVQESVACRKEVPNKLEVFVMSQCPYGVKALDAMQEVLKNFGDKLEFSRSSSSATATLRRGSRRCTARRRSTRTCARSARFKHYAKKNKFMGLHLVRNKDIRSADWKKCTGGTTGIDTAKIQKCSEGDEGKKLLEASYKLASSMGIGGSPTWMANNKHKFSGIDAETVRKNVCQHNASLQGCDKKLSGSSGPPVEGGCGK
jgi:glutaredoxin